jgi:uncharacterized protein (TIGR03435 family)
MRDFDQRGGVAVGLVLALGAAAQEPAFEVASVKHSGNTLARTSRTRGFAYSGRRMNCNLPLTALVEYAYDVKDWQLQAPAWMGSETYELAATMPEGSGRDAARLMMRSMLAERFGLKVRRALKEFAVFGLVAIPGTSKLEKVVDPPPTFGHKVSPGGLEAEPGMPLRALAEILTRAAGKPVIDEAGLAGWYKIRLRWNADPPAAGGVINANNDPGILSAIGQMGLKLEAKRRVFDVLTVESARKEPTES